MFQCVFLCSAQYSRVEQQVGCEGMQNQPEHQPEQVPIENGPFLSSRQACDGLGYSRPDSFLRAWRAAGLPVFRRASGRLVIAMADVERFLSPDNK